MMSLIFNPKSDACLVPRHRRRDRYSGVGAAICKPAIDTRTVPSMAERLRLSVLVPVDFTDTTPVSVYVGWSLARHAGGTLCLLHVVGRPAFMRRSEEATWAKSVEEMSATALRHLKRIVERLQPPGVSIACLIRQGNTSAEICACARTIGADVIVIARRRPRFLKPCLSALTADRIARDAHCNVLLLPVNATVPATTLASEAPL